MNEKNMANGRQDVEVIAFKGYPQAFRCKVEEAVSNLEVNLQKVREMRLASSKKSVPSALSFSRTSKKCNGSNEVSCFLLPMNDAGDDGTFNFHSNGTITFEYVGNDAMVGMDVSGLPEAQWLKTHILNQN